MDASRRRPSPALVIAVLALFVALGGSAYAAKKIGSKDIRAGAVTTAKLKKNAVTTAKIKGNAVTGAKVKESSLATVPSATTAANFAKYHSSGLIKLSAGQSKQVMAIGPFTFTTSCKDIGAGSFEVETVLTTSQAGSNMAGEADEYNESNFNPGTEAVVGHTEFNNNPHVANEGYGGYYAGFFASSGDGATLLSGEVNNMVLSYGSQCAVWMWAIQG